jgi:hypothetical protein
MRSRACVCVVLLALARVARAHPGGLNAEGCPNNRKTGEYHCHRAPSRPLRAESTGRAAGGCGDKRTCGEMSSCAEARHYLVDCGIGRLDGDGDGVPCEKLCR